MKFLLPICLAIVPLAPAATSAPAQDPAQTELAFPVSTAKAEGVSPEALSKLGDLVRSLVDQNEVVGAELMVIKNGRSILHQSYGWRDREAELPMENGSVFCVRSMTKPLIGTSILMLIEQDKLKLDDKVSKFLPAFEAESTREITIEHLLTHTSGLPMSLIIGKDLRELGNIQTAAQLGAGYELEFKPGSGFNYSDHGTDTLTAIIELVSGMPAAEFVQTRLLDPLGMQSSATLMTEGHPLRTRGCAKYAGGRGNWSPFWTPEREPLFPFFLGSQGLYSTVSDYARFMNFWLQKGRAGQSTLLDAELIHQALTPSPYPLGAPTGLPGQRVDYGFLMELWTRPDQGDKDGRRVVTAFGHNGSDGTHAWVFPEQNAMVLYFTQSRGTMSGLQVEEALGELFFGVAPEVAQTAPPLEQYLGYYWEHDDDHFRAIVLDGDGLAIEVPGRAVVPLTYIGEDRWKLNEPGVVVAFERSESGDITGYQMGDDHEIRFEPSPDLPSIQELSTLVTQTHRFERLKELGPLRLNTKVTFPKLGMTGEASTLYAWPNRYRSEAKFGSEFENITYDGENVWYASKLKPAAMIEGAEAENFRLDSHLARLGDWSKWYPKMRVIQKLERGGKSLLLVRTGDTHAPARTLFIDADTGQVLGEDNVMLIEGMGRMGLRTRFGDFRDVSGMLLPFSIKVKYANSLIGTVNVTVESFELGLDLPDATFSLEQ
jgi:CubicO group peptidase (beta-lactamase class C family)